MNKIITITMERNFHQIDMFDPDRLTGHLNIMYQKDGRTTFVSLPTLENRNYIFPVGVYEVKFEYSPKFGKKLWEFKDIPKRSEIKFHEGSLPHHSLGCPLLRPDSLRIFHSILDSEKNYFINVKNK